MVYRALLTRLSLSLLPSLSNQLIFPSLSIHYHNTPIYHASHYRLRRQSVLRKRTATAILGTWDGSRYCLNATRPSTRLARGQAKRPSQHSCVPPSMNTSAGTKQAVASDTHVVKFQTIVRDGKEIVVGRLKVPTVSLPRIA